MSAEVLREAAKNLREWWPDCDCHEPERAVADWLEYVAQTWRMRPVGNGGPLHGGDQEQALAVATAYLGTR